MTPRARRLLFTLAVLAIVCAWLPGCATCERHPVACSVAGVVVVGAITYGLTRHSSPHDYRTPPCVQIKGSCVCQPGNC